MGGSWCPDREIQREKVREGWREEMAEAATRWWFGRGRGGGGGGSGSGGGGGGGGGGRGALCVRQW